MNFLRRFALLALPLLGGSRASEILRAPALHARNDTLDPDMAQVAMYDLPMCADACLIQVFPRFNCELDNFACMCSNGNLTSDLQACLYSNCTRPDELLAVRYQRNTCDAPVRSEQDETRALTWALFGLASVFVAARFVARPQRFKGSGYGTDDFTIGAVYLLLIPLNVLVQTMTVVGLGTDDYTNAAWQITAMLRQFYFFQILYIILVMTSKISILQLYLRIWTESAVSVWFRRFCWLLIGVHIATMVAYVFASIFQCTPVAYAWYWWDGTHEGHCIKRLGMIYSLGAINIAYDVIVFFLPLHNFLKLNISWRRKIGVCVAFMIGCLVTICSIVRLQYLVRIGVGDDVTWEYNAIVQWSSVECNLSVVCTCIPAMAGLMQRCWAIMSGKPGSTASTRSTAPIKPKTIDPENPVEHDEMLHMEPRGSMSGSMTEYNASDVGAPTKVRSHDKDDDAATDVELGLSAPAVPTATRLTYRDHTGRLHDVKVIDKPTEDMDPRQARRQPDEASPDHVENGDDDDDRRNTIRPMQGGGDDRAPQNTRDDLRSGRGVVRNESDHSGSTL